MSVLDRTAAAAGTSGPKNRWPRRGRPAEKYDARETRAAFAFLAPWIIGFLVFTFAPMIWSLVLSFTNYNLVDTPKNVGFRNYQRMFDDAQVHTALANTFFYAVLFVPLAIVVALGLAMMLNRLTAGTSFFRTVFYLPVMTPAVAVAVLFSLLLNGNYGLLNKTLALVGIHGPQWLTDPDWIKPSIVLMSLWGLGSAVVIFLAALKNVPTDLYEAASIDGASKWRTFRSITVPMISPALFFQVIILTITALQMFDKVYVLFGNPGSATYAGNASLFYAMYLFQQAFQALRMGYASALAWLLFVIIMIITAIQVKVGNKLVYYEGGQEVTTDVRTDLVGPAPVESPDPIEIGGSRPPLTRLLLIPYVIVLSVLAVIFMYPLLWLLSASFKTRATVFDNKLFPSPATLANYSEVWHVAPVLTWLANSSLVGLLAAATATASSAVVAFGFAYFRFRAKNPLFGLVLSSMMLPSMVTMIPVFLIWKDLGLLGTRVPLWGGNLFGSAFYIFMLRQFFLGLPRELFEAARIDGCSYFGLFRRIAVPLSKPALIIVFVFEFQASWDDLLKPLIYLGNQVDLYTVPLGLNSLFVKFNPIAGGEGDFQYIVTAALLATIPMVLIFLFGQRFFVEGIATQGRKG